MAKGKIKVYYDAEFTGLHRNTSLVSIGMVAENGSYFYAEFSDYDRLQVTPWIQENIIDNLVYKDKEFYISPLIPYKPFIYSKPVTHNCFNTIIKADRREIKERLLSWLWSSVSNHGEEEIQIYSDCYTYNWMMLMDLICENGDALSLPNYMNYIPMDLSTMLLLVGKDPDINREEFAGICYTDMLREAEQFSHWKCNLRYNCLWNAAVCMGCIYKILNLTNPSHTIYSTKIGHGNSISNIPNVSIVATESMPCYEDDLK